jgi:hypothetical protein
MHQDGTGLALPGLGPGEPLAAGEPLTEGDPLGAGDALGAMVRLGIGLGEGIGVSAPPTPNSTPFRRMRTNTSTEPTTNSFDARSVM